MHKVSIIVPIFNSEKYLFDCIDSIINQTYKNIEILLIDDGSTDSSVSICKKFKNKDDRIKVICKDNTGVSDTRNVGIDKSTGEYIMFVDSDDYLERNAVEIMVKYIIQSKVDVVRCCAKIYNKDNSNYDKENVSLEGRYSQKDLIDNLTYFLSQDHSICCYVWALLIKRDFIVKFNTKLSFMEDTEFYIRLFTSIESMLFLHEYLYNYRYVPTGLSKNSDKCQLNISRLDNSMNEIIKFLEDNKISNHIQLSEDLRIKVFNSMIFQLLLASKMPSINKIRRLLTNVFTGDIRSSVLKINFSKLRLNKKVMFSLIKIKFYYLLAIVLKILSKKI